MEKWIPESLGLNVAEILGRIGFQRGLHLGALSVLFSVGFLVEMAACSVRSRWEREGRALRIWISFQAMLCPVVME